MSTPLISATAALLGVVVGQALARSGEYRKWLRTEQHKACAILLDACESIKLQRATYASIKELAFKFSQTGLRNSPKFREIMRDELLAIISTQGIFELSDDVFEKALDVFFEANQGEIHAETLKQFKASVGRDEKTLLDDMVAATMRLMHAVESLRLICPDTLMQKAVKLRAATLDMLSSQKEFEEADKLYLRARDEFTAEVRLLLLGKTRRASLWDALRGRRGPAKFS